MRKIDALCKGKCGSGLFPTAMLLLKKANKYVGVHNSIGAMDLSTEIVEFIAAIERQEKGL
ncbi:hypothetical protein AXX02_22635 [Pseudomonas aeruginosa]|nr:hypothetical protein [Pseudomonas aeruginosa]RIZ48194.1 hypothetical protein AXX02_22635 [Pseudomonas aeruginosa]